MSKLLDWASKKDKVSSKSVNFKFRMGVVLFIFLGVFLKYVDSGLELSSTPSFIYVISGIFIGFMIICYSIYQFRRKFFDRDNRNFLVEKLLDVFTLMLGISTVVLPLLYTDKANWLTTLIVYFVTVTMIVPIMLIFLLLLGLPSAD